MDPVQAGQQWVRSWAQALPLSGDVLQRIVTSWFRDGQFGLVNVQGVSRDPGLEERIVTQVAGYGRQLGRLMEAVEVLARHPPGGLTDKEKEPLADLCTLAEEIADVRRKAAAEKVGTTVTQVKELCEDPVGNADAIRRIRELLPPAH
jgi:hypothetical protein